MKPTTPFRLLAATLLLLALALAGPASAATRTWVGGNGSWMDPMKWSPQEVPGAGDTAVISGTDALTIAVTDNRSIGRLVLDNPNATLRVTDLSGAYAELTVANGFENRGTIELANSANGTTLTVTTGALTNAAGGTIRVPAGSGTGYRLLDAPLDNRGTFEVETNLNMRKNVANSGTINLPDGVTMTFQNGIIWTHQGGTVTGTGTLVIPGQSGSQLELETDFTPGAYVLDAGANLTVNGPGKLFGPPTGELQLNQWTINTEVVVSGSMRIKGDTRINGTLSVLSGKTLRVLETITGGMAALTVAKGFENHGTIELASELGSGNTVTLTVTSGTLTNASDGVLRATASGGRGVVAANLDNRGTLEATAGLRFRGNVANSGTVHIPESQILSLQQQTIWTHQGGTITGAGTLEFGAFNGSRLELETDFTPGAYVLEAQGFTVNGPGKLFTGEFLIRQWTINAPMVVSGDLRLERNVAVNSTLAVAPGATLRVVGRSGAFAELTATKGIENRGVIELTSADSEGEATLTVTTGALTNLAGGVLRALEGTGGPRYFNGNLDNRGTLGVQADLTLAGNVANSGTVDIPEGKRVAAGSPVTWTHQGGSITGTGTLALGSGSTLALEADFTPGNYFFDSIGLKVNGPGTLLGPPTGEFLVRQWTINAPLVVSGDLRLELNVTVNSALTVAEGKTLRVVGRPGAWAELTATKGIENRGVIELTSADSAGGATLTVTTGALTNLAGGVLRALAGSGGPRTLNAVLDNRGTLEAGVDLALTRNVANSGVVNIPEGKTVAANSPITWTHQGGSITGTGTLSLGSVSTLALEADFTPGNYFFDSIGLKVNGPGTLLGPPTGEFVIRKWTINAAALVTGDLRVEGQVNFNSALTVAEGKALRVVGRSGAFAELTAAKGIENRGVIELTSADSEGGATLTVTTGALTNLAGGVLRALEGSGGPRMLSAVLDNRGTLEAGVDLALTRNVANSGVVNIPEGKTMAAAPAITWTHQGGAITGTGTLSLFSGSTLALEADFTPGNYFFDSLGLRVNGPGTLLGPPTGEFLVRQWTINAPLVVSGDLRLERNVAINSPLAVSPGKTLRVVGKSGAFAELTVASGFENRGVIELTSVDSNGGATLRVTTGTLTNAVGGAIRVLEGTGGPRTLNANLDNRGTLLGMGNTFLVMNGALLNATTGVLAGNGAFNFASTTITNEGTVAPGASSGILTINGKLPHSAGSRFAVEIGGLTAGTEHDQLVLANPATFAGTIRPVLVNGFFPRRNDTFTVLTYPSRTGTFATLDNPLPERIAWEVRYGATSAQLVVLNSAPTLAAITNQTVDEQVQFSVTASATDQDLPAQTLTYSLVTAPDGMAINPSSGRITWTPTEAQGPGNFDVTVRVTDNGTPSLGHTTSFKVTVNEVNVAPQLVLPASVTADEQAELVFTVNGTDADLPANALTYELVSGPAGATFNAATRELRWTPSEAQGPGSFTATFRLTDNNPDAVNEQQLSATGAVSLTVAEVNLRPTLAGIGAQTATEESPFSVTATATDPDLPANGLVFSLATAPTGMTINPATGAITWTPTEAQGPGAHDVTVRVTDNGSPALAHTTSFKVTVSEVNLPPAVAGVPGATIHAGAVFTTTLGATDPDVPANAFTYSLVSGPAGATVSAAGKVAWTPSLAAAGSVAEFTVRVTDDGSPAASGDRTFRVTVVGPVEILAFARNGEELELTWRAVAGRSYRVIQADVLPAAGWSPVPGNVQATGNTAAKSVPIGVQPGGRFFRVELIEE